MPTHFNLKNCEQLTIKSSMRPSNCWYFQSSQKTSKRPPIEGLIDWIESNRDRCILDHIVTHGTVERYKALMRLSSDRMNNIQGFGGRCDSMKIWARYILQRRIFKNMQASKPTITQYYANVNTTRLQAINSPRWIKGVVSRAPFMAPTPWQGDDTTLQNSSSSNPGRSQRI